MNISREAAGTQLVLKQCWLPTSLSWQGFEALKKRQVHGFQDHFQKEEVQTLIRVIQQSWGLWSQKLDLSTDLQSSFLVSAVYTH